jgi:hypothetical protein
VAGRVGGILAPLYLRRLLGLDEVDDDYLEGLADPVATWGAAP